MTVKICFCCLVFCDVWCLLLKTCWFLEIKKPLVSLIQILVFVKHNDCFNVSVLHNVENALEIWVISYMGDQIFAQEKKRKKKCRGRMRFRRRFAIRVVNDGAPNSLSENCLVMFFELPAGDVWQKVKKQHCRQGGVAKTTIRVPMLHGDQKKKWSACSMGMLKTVFATPPARESLFAKSSFFVVVYFVLIWCGEHVVKMNEPLRFSKFWKKIRKWKN